MNNCVQGGVLLSVLPALIAGIIWIEIGGSTFGATVVTILMLWLVTCLFTKLCEGADDEF